MKARPVRFFTALEWLSNPAGVWTVRHVCGILMHEGRTEKHVTILCETNTNKARTVYG